MRQQEPGLSGPIAPLELIKHFPGEPCAASDRRQWVGLEALRYRDQPPNEAHQPPLTHHTLLLFLHTPKEFEMQCDGVNRVVPPRAGSILVVPAGSPVRYRWSSHSDSLHVFLEPGLVERVAAEAFDLDAVRAPVPPLDGMELPLSERTGRSKGRGPGGGGAADQVDGEKVGQRLGGEPAPGGAGRQLVIDRQHRGPQVREV